MLRHLNQYLARPVTLGRDRQRFCGRAATGGSEGGARHEETGSRRCDRSGSASGLISIMGGKWTTHRAMAEDTIHRVQEALGRATDGIYRLATTFFTAVRASRRTIGRQLCRQHPISEETARHLTSKFGTAAEKVLAVAQGRSAAYETDSRGSPAIRAEVVTRFAMKWPPPLRTCLRAGSGCSSIPGEMRLTLRRSSVRLHGGGVGDGPVTFTREAITSYVEKINHLLDSAACPANALPSR